MTALKWKITILEINPSDLTRYTPVGILLPTKRKPRENFENVARSLNT